MTTATTNRSLDQISKSKNILLKSRTKVTGNKIFCAGLQRCVFDDKIRYTTKYYNTTVSAWKNRCSYKIRTTIEFFFFLDGSWAAHNVFYFPLLTRHGTRLTKRSIQRKYGRTSRNRDHMLLKINGSRNIINNLNAWILSFWRTEIRLFARRGKIIFS